MISDPKSNELRNCRLTSVAENKIKDFDCLICVGLKGYIHQTGDEFVAQEMKGS